jgi:hypothetical protein
MDYTFSLDSSVVEPYVLGSFLPASKGVGSVSVELSVVGTAGDSHLYSSSMAISLSELMMIELQPMSSSEQVSGEKK